MKNLSSFLTFVILFVSLTLQAQLEEMINKSEQIIYGTVVDKSSNWNREKTLIFTTNKVKIIDIFKGDFRDSIITVITPGGMVDDFFQFQSHAIELAVSHSGYFFLKGGNESNFNFVDIKKGFCQRNDDLNPKISFNGIQYVQDKFEKMIMKETQIPRIRFSYLRENNFEIREADRDSCDVISARHENTIALTIGNININGVRQYIDFDVMAKVNTSGLKFGKGFLVLKYSKKIGSNLVTSGSLEITKGNIIKNKLYDLRFQDINSSNILIKIDSKTPSDSLFTFNENSESILHFRFNLNDFLKIEDITKKDLKVMGNLFYYCIDDYRLFDSLLVDGGFQPTYSNSTIGIEYTFENGVVTQNNTKFSIDLFAKATAPSLYSDGVLYIDYNQLGFKSNVSNGNITFVQKDLIANTNQYFVTVEDHDFNTFSISIFSDEELGAYEGLSTTPRKIGTLTFNVKDCNQLKGLKFDQELSGLLHTYFASDLILYDPVIMNDQENGKICGCDKPVVTSFSPTTIHAGTGEILTINGSNFGNWDQNLCTVKFPNGDDDGPTEMEAGMKDFEWDNIIHWTDTEIKIKVPSVDKIGLTQHPASTGKIKVKNQCDISNQSNDILQIPFAIFNVRPGQLGGETYKMTLKENSSSGICFVFTDDMPSWIRDQFIYALQEWCSETGINFTIGGYVNSNTNLGLDNINLVKYMGQTSFPGGGMRIDPLYFNSACSSETERGYPFKEIDFQIYSGYGPVSEQESVVKEILIHELGHAHMLAHSNSGSGANQYLMHPNGNVGGIITSADSDGANLVFTNSANIVSGCGTPIGSGHCGQNCSSSKNDESDNDSLISIYPNPTNDLLNIQFNVENNNMYAITLFDSKGIKIYNNILNFQNPIKLKIPHNPGIYILKIEGSVSSYIRKIIKL